MNFVINDRVKCLMSASYVTKDSIYVVYRTAVPPNDRAYIIDDDGDENSYPNDMFELYKTASGVTAQPQAAASAHQVGDVITVNIDLVDCTKGKQYIVARVTPTGIEIHDDSGDPHFIINKNVSSVNSGTHAQAVAAVAPRATVVPRAFHAQYGSSNVVADDVTITVEDDDDYDSRKANAKVTSQGLFSVGTRLVYEDGTPTLTSLTVKRCTATSVWFEETYSTPFNPDEFRVEY